MSFVYNHSYVAYLLNGSGQWMVCIGSASCARSASYAVQDKTNYVHTQGGSDSVIQTDHSESFQPLDPKKCSWV